MRNIQVLVSALILSAGCSQAFAVDTCAGGSGTGYANLCHTVTAQIPSSEVVNCSHIKVQLLPGGPAYNFAAHQTYKNGVQYQTSLLLLDQLAGPIAIQAGTYKSVQTTYTCDTGTFTDQTNLVVQKFQNGRAFQDEYGSTIPDNETIPFYSAHG